MTKPKPNLGGVAAVADLLNHMERADRERLLGEITKRDPALASRIEEQLFTFDSIAHLDDQTVQLLLREVEQSVLALALRSASEEVKATVFRNLSKRAADSLREEMDGSPPRKISDVQSAQSAITLMAKSLLKPKK